MAWNMPRRETVTKTAAGAIRNAWRNRYRGTYYDEPTVTITFQTGNMMPGAGIPDSIFGSRRIEYYTNNQGFKVPTSVRDGGYADRVAQILQTPPIPPGIVNFYDFLSLVDQPMLSSNNNENRHILLVRTRLFPRIRLEGYFTQDPITFTESATAANSITWNATFMVYDSTPRLWSADALKVAFSDAVRSYGAMSEIIPKDFDLEEFQKYWQGATGQDLNDANLPYQTTKLDSQTGKKKKQVGLVAKSGAKTAAGVNPVTTVEDLSASRQATTKELLGTYKSGISDASTVGGETMTQTKYWPNLSQAIDQKFANAEVPPTQEEVNLFASEWMVKNMDEKDLEKFSNLLQRLDPDIENLSSG